MTLLPCLFFFFLMIRRPPRSTLFPYTSSSDLASIGCRESTRSGSSPRREASCLIRFASRSEEHTSELQSQSNLVCRLLLEKKKSIAHRARSDTWPRPAQLHLCASDTALTEAVR